MTDRSLLNDLGRPQICFTQFSRSHDISLTEGVNCFRLRGSRGDYVIVRDTRTHPLALFTNSTKPEIMHNKESEVRNKLIGNLRDKWNEADRPFVPRKYRTPETWQATTTIIPTTELGLLRIENNKPVFSIWPQWCLRDEPILTLLLRIPHIFQWLMRRPEIVAKIMEDRIHDRIDWIRFIEDQEGQGPLESIGFRHIHSVIVTDLCPKATTIIPFQPFEIQSTELTTILSAEAFLTSLSEYDILPPYAMVRGSQDPKFEYMPLEHNGYTLRAWIGQTQGDLYETYSVAGSEDRVVIYQPHRIIGTQIVMPFDLASLRSATFLLYSLSRPASLESGLSTIVLRTEGTYIPYQQQGNHSSLAIPFRDPMSCTSTTVEDLKDTDFPFIIQPKLDGNRIIVHIDLSSERGTAKYYSRNGVVQTGKFNQQFDRDVLAFATKLSARMGGIRNLQLDCECYAHDVVHAEIGGWCNRVAITNEFRQLQLHILSWLDLDQLTTIHARGRDYTVSSTTFRDILIRENMAIEMMIEELSKENPEYTLRLNPSLLVNDRDHVFQLMSQIVEAGCEGLVLYPPDKPYTFNNSGLKKIKKFYDGECTIISYEASKTDPGAIGSVLVSTNAYFAKSADNERPPAANDNSTDRSISRQFYVTAALRQDIKSGSMTSARFANCIGKQFTIICGSFSDTGIPIHARFKAPFGPENERLDAT